MSHRHPSGVIVDVVGIEEPSQGRSREEHATCGDILEVDTVVRFCAIHILNGKKKEETAIAAYWVTDGVNRCRVCFLPRFCIKHKSNFDGKLAQITDLLSKSSNSSDRKKSQQNCGVANAVLIEVEVE